MVMAPIRVQMNRNRSISGARCLIEQLYRHFLPSELLKTQMGLFDFFKHESIRMRTMGEIATATTFWKAPKSGQVLDDLENQKCEKLKGNFIGPIELPEVIGPVNLRNFWKWQ